MLKRIIKTVNVAVTIVCLFVCLVPIYAFAVDPISYTALSGALDAYGMAYGIGTVVDVTSSSGVDASFSGLWDEFSQYQSNNGSSYDYSQFVIDFNENPSIDAFSHSSGKFAAWHIDPESAEIFDQFWNWLLTGPAEMSRVDNEYFQFNQSQIGSSATSLFVFGLGAFSNQPLPVVSSSLSNQQKYEAGYFVGENSSFSWRASTPSSSYSVYACFVGNQLTFFSPYSFTVQYVSSYLSSGNRQYAGSSQSGSYDSNLHYYFSTSVGNQSWTVKALPQFSSRSEAVASLSSWLVTPTYSETIGVKSDTDDGKSYLPNPYGVDYVPVPLDLVTSVPWDESYPDSDDDNGVPVPYPPSSIPNVVDDIISAMIDDTYELVEEDDEPIPPPQEVLLPFIPVNIPSFNFNFSGIWHYVREWVTSLGAWFVTLFSIWSILPYAMVVPVYATAVIVIVLGVYKRFFL